MMPSQRVALELSGDEALVFFDWLRRFNKGEHRVFEDQAEQRVLWDLEAILESTLSEPLDPKYLEVLAAARGRVRDSE